MDEGPQPPPLNRIGGPFSVHEVAVPAAPRRARAMAAALVATRPVTQCGATLGTQLCSEITLRTLTLPESDRPAGP